MHQWPVGTEWIVALKSTVVGWSDSRRHSTALLDSTDSYEVLIEDEMVDYSVVRHVSLSSCLQAIEGLGVAHPSDDILAGVARAVAVRDYLREIGEDPDAPTLG
jgi:hypothetical protein